MKRLRFVCGVVALLATLAGLNALVIFQDLFNPMVMGLLGTGIITAIFWIALAVTALVRSSSAEGKTAYSVNSALGSLLFFGICIVVFAFVQHNGRSWDLTKEGRRKLSDQTVQVCKVLNKDVEITGFFPQIDDELVRIAREKTKRFLEQCQQYTSHLKVQFLDPQADPLQLQAMGVTHASPQGTIVIHCGTRQKVIMLQGSSPRMEEKDFTNALINVIRDAQPKISFLSGHGERNIEDPDPRKGASVFKRLLEGESYLTERIEIAIERPEIPTDCSLLIINGLGVSGAQGDLHPEEIKAIQAFLDRGGRLLVMLDPWRRVTSGANVSEQLVPWLAQRYGILVGDNIVVAQKGTVTVEFSGDKTLFPENKPDDAFQGGFNMQHPITKGFDQKLMFRIARTVDLADKMPEKVIGVRLLRTTPDYFAETDLATLMATGKAIKTADEKVGPLPMAVAVEAQTEAAIGDTDQTHNTRIVVVGDSDYVMNENLGAPTAGNLNFILNAIAWLTENEDLIAIRPTGKEDPPLTLSEKDQRIIVWVSSLGTLQLVAIAGLLAYWLRRKYQ